MAPQPNIENLHKRPKGQKKILLVVNGKSHHKVKTPKGLIKLINTHPIDTIIHCIRVGYYDWYNYHEYVNKNNSQIVKIIKMLSFKGLSKKIYAMRVEIMLKVQPVENNMIHCNLNIYHVISSVLSGLSCIIITTDCVKCNDEKDEHITVITPDLRPLYDTGISALQESVDQYLPFYKRRCDGCGDRKTVTILSNDHIFIGIEILYNNLCNTKSKNQQGELLESTSLDLKISLKHFALVGAVEYIKSARTSHYRPCVRRINERWELHDDIAQESKVKKFTKKELDLSGRIFSYDLT